MVGFCEHDIEHLRFKKANNLATFILHWKKPGSWICEFYNGGGLV
jgi:hypothetical protein